MSSEYLACVFVYLNHFEWLHIGARWGAEVILGPCNSSINLNWNLNISSSVCCIGENSKWLIFIGEIAWKIYYIWTGDISNNSIPIGSCTWFGLQNNTVAWDNWIYIEWNSFRDIFTLDAIIFHNMLDVIRLIGKILHIESKRMHCWDGLIICWNLLHEISPFSTAKSFKSESIEWTSAVNLYA